MLLTISTTHRPANDLGYLLHKHPERFQSFDLSFGKAHVYYPEVGAERCSACLMFDVDAVVGQGAGTPEDPVRSGRCGGAGGVATGGRFVGASHGTAERGGTQ